MIAAVILDWCFGEPRRWHLLVVFGAVAPPTALIAMLIRVPRMSVALQILVLYLVIGRRSLHLHARRVAEALDDDDLPAARHRVAMMVSRDTGAMQHTEIARAAVESVL